MLHFEQDTPCPYFSRIPSRKCHARDLWETKISKYLCVIAIFNEFKMDYVVKNHLDTRCPKKYKIGSGNIKGDQPSSLTTVGRPCLFWLY